MFESRRARKQAGREREALAPMARSLGLDPSLSMVEPPVGPPARIMGAYRVGQLFLAKFEDPGMWPLGVPWGHSEESPIAQRGAKLVAAALASEGSLNAVSWMAQRYGHESAARMRRLSESPTDLRPQQRKDAVANAEASEELADQTAAHWPVEDPFGVFDLIESAARARDQAGIDLDNPTAMIDLHAYFNQSAAACGALGLLIGQRLDEELRFALFHAVANIEVPFSVMLNLGWVRAYSF